MEFKLCRVTDPNFPCGFNDVISLDKTDEHFRMLFDVKGRYVLHRLNNQKYSGEMEFKLCRVNKLALGAKGIPYVSTHDGRTIRYPTKRHGAMPYAAHVGSKGALDAAAARDDTDWEPPADARCRPDQKVLVRAPPGWRHDASWPNLAFGDANYSRIIRSPRQQDRRLWQTEVGFILDSKYCT